MRRFTAALYVLLLGLSSVCAQAAEQECAPSVREWTEAWAQQAGVTVEALLCPSDAEILVLRVGTGDSGPFTIEVTSHPERAYARISAQLGASPIADISDFQELPESHRNAFDSLCSWAAANSGKVHLDAAPPAQAAEFVGEQDPFPPPILEAPRYERMRWVGPWLFLAGFLALLAALWRGRAHLAGSRWHAPVLFAVAVAGRLALGIWGPLHTNFQGSMWVEAAYNPIQSEWYGPGYPEMFHWLARLFADAPDYALFSAIGLLSALTPLLAMATLRIARCDPAVAFSAGLLLAVDPVSCRVAATENYLPLLVALNLAVLLASVMALRARLAGEKSLAVVALLAAGLLAAHTVRVHPVGWLPLLITIPLAANCIARGTRQWLVCAAWLAAAIGALCIVSYGDQALFNAARIQFATGHRFDIRSYFPPWAAWSVGVIVLLAASLPWIPALRSRGGRIVLVAISLLLLLATRFQYAQAANWQASYDRLFLVPAALALFALLPRNRWSRFVTPALAALLALLALLNVGFSFFRSDLQQRQYSFARQVLATTSPDCGIAFPGGWENSTHGIPHYIASGPVRRVPRGHPVADVLELRKLRERSECLYLLRPVIADRDDHGGLWQPFAGLSNLRLVAEQSFLAEEQKAYGRYQSTEVVAAIYEVGPFEGSSK